MKYQVQKSSVSPPATALIDVEDRVGQALVVGVPVGVARMRRHLRLVDPIEVELEGGARVAERLVAGAVRQCRLLRDVLVVDEEGVRGRALVLAAAAEEEVVGELDGPVARVRIAEVDVHEVEQVRVLVVEVDRDRPVLEQVLGRAQVGAGLGVELVDGVLDALHAVGLLLEDLLDQEVAARAVVLQVRVEITAAVTARLLPEVQEVRERRAVVLEAAAPAGQRGLAMEDLVIREVRAARAGSR